MSEEEKYYVPELEEFYPGFEYLIGWGLKNINREWIEEVFSIEDDPQNPFNNIEHYRQSDKLRVKYLDREDIESFGWSFDEQREDISFKFHLFLKDFRNRGGAHITMAHNIKSNWITISVGFIGRFEKTGNETSLFSGTIKNKSEFKKLLTQLRINE